GMTVPTKLVITVSTPRRKEYVVSARMLISSVLPKKRSKDPVRPSTSGTMAASAARFALVRSRPGQTGPRTRGAVEGQLACPDYPDYRRRRGGEQEHSRSDSECGGADRLARSVSGPRVEAAPSPSRRQETGL